MTLITSLITHHQQSIQYSFTVAVVVAFILCWAPFHAQRLFAFYDNNRPVLYAIITYTSGVMYYLSTCINPLLYHLMSNKFREAFKVRFLYIILIFIQFVNPL